MGGGREVGGGEGMELSHFSEHCIIVARNRPVDFVTKKFTNSYSQPSHPIHACIELYMAAVGTLSV